MADPLSQLRQYYISNRDNEIKEINGFIVFGDHGWPKTVNTNYQIYSSDDDKSKKEYYTLECLWNFLKHQNLAHTHYVKQGGTDNVPVVHRPDRKSLLAYLKGETQSSPSIDKNAPIPSLKKSTTEILKSASDKFRPTGDSYSIPSSSLSSNEQSQNDLILQNDASSRPVAKRPHDPEVEKKAREEFAARLYEPSSKKMATIIPIGSAEKSGETAGSSAAINQFGAEKLAALRAKRMAVKRTTIPDADMDINKSGSGINDTVNKEADMLIAMDSDPAKLIKSKEKIWRTRSSVLQAQSKNFYKTISPFLNLLNKMEDPKSRVPGITATGGPNEMQSNPYQQNSAHSQNSQAIQQRNAYNRYDQERFVKLDIGVEIDTKKSFVNGVSNGLGTYSQATQQATPIKPGGQISSQGMSNPQHQQQQHPHHTQPHNRPHDSMDGNHHHNHHHSQQNHHSQQPQSHRPHGRPTKRQSTVPIIVIPATDTSLINMHNAQTILQDLTYTTGNPDKGRENEILIQRKKADGSHAYYKIVDNPVRLDADDWNRVVAVFVQGPAWQFKGWPWGGAPVEIFSRIKAFHLKWDEAKLDSNVSKWNVQVLQLSRNKRHLDKAILLKFWSSLDAFMVKYKSFLKF